MRNQNRAPPFSFRQGHTLPLSLKDTIKGEKMKNENCRKMNWKIELNTKKIGKLRIRSDDLKELTKINLTPSSR